VRNSVRLWDCATTVIGLHVYIIVFIFLLLKFAPRT